MTEDGISSVALKAAAGVNHEDKGFAGALVYD